MYALVITVLFLVGIGYGQVLYSLGTPSQQGAYKAEAAMGNFNAYVNAVDTKVRVLPGFTGVIQDSSLVFPPSYKRNAAWTNVVTSDLVVVYSSQPATTVFSNGPQPIYNSSERYLSGIVSGSKVVTSTDGVSQLILPPVVPQGALAWVSRR